VFQTWYDILWFTFFEALWQGFLGFFIPSYEDVGICQRVFGHCQIALPRCKIVHLLQPQYDTTIPNQNKDVEARKGPLAPYISMIVGEILNIMTLNNLWTKISKLGSW